VSQNDSLIMGVDIGGTKVGAGLVDTRGQITTRARKPMVAQRSAEEGLAAVLRVIQTVLASAIARTSEVSAIGVSTPGYVDPVAGMVLSATNLPCWRDYPLGPMIAEATGLPVFLDNDGNAAALAEAVWGAGAGYRSVFYVTLGTGIGSGFVLHGRVHHGRTGGAGEGGHMTIDYRGPLCLCGKRGCIEMYASGQAISKRARASLTAARRRTATAAQRHAAASSKLLELADGNIEDVTAEMVGKASMEGDPLATKVLEDAAESLAIWLGGIIDLLEPDVIVVGGGLGHLMASFFGFMRTQLQRWSINPRGHEVPIVSAMYGAVSGIAGAAALCRQSLHEKD
jgi:glucokinase